MLSSALASEAASPYDRSSLLVGEAACQISLKSAPILTRLDNLESPEDMLVHQLAVLELKVEVEHHGAVELQG